MNINIVYCVVLYRTKIWDSKVYKTLLSRISNESVIYIYDNSPIPEHQKEEFIGQNIYYISNTQNPGISKAYNEAAKFAKRNNYKWLMLLDQDTSISVDITKLFCEQQNQNKSIKLFIPKVKIAVNKYISPTIIKHHITKITSIVPSGVVELFNYTMINSGMIVDVDALISIGGYNEKVWLDYSDHEFISRFKKKYSQVYVLDFEVEQELSDFVNSPRQKMKRYEIYCECIKHCHRFSAIDHIDYLYIVIKKSISLTIQTKSLKPFIIFIKKYIL